MRACSLGCLLGCLVDRLLACLFACVRAVRVCARACVWAGGRAYVHACVLVCSLACLFVCLFACLHACLLVRLRACMRSYVHSTRVLSCAWYVVRTYWRAGVRACVSTCLRGCMRGCMRAWMRRKLSPRALFLSLSKRAETGHFVVSLVIAYVSFRFHELRSKRPFFSIPFLSRKHCANPILLSRNNDDPLAARRRSGSNMEHDPIPRESSLRTYAPFEIPSENDRRTPRTTQNPPSPSSPSHTVRTCS